MHTTLKEVVGTVAGVLLTGLVCMAAAIASDDEPGKDYPMPKLKEDYNPHKKGGNLDDV